MCRRYKIVAASPPSGMKYFGIGGCSGKLYVASAGLDVLKQPSYNLTVHVTDNYLGDALSDTGNVTINIIEAPYPPYFLVDSSQVFRAVDSNHVFSQVTQYLS